MLPSKPKRHQSSFRDPGGFIFEHQGKIYRQINHDGAEDYEYFMKCGLYESLSSKGLLVEHQEVAGDNKFTPDEKRYKIIRPAQIPFISYPYEWTFSQLKDAALLTLKIQKEALKHGMILKDSSAYNVQFIGRMPVFIDTLSFWRYKTGETWEGYRQFCEHFIMPLALAAYVSQEIFRTMRVFINGLPIDLGEKLLPPAAHKNPGLAVHVYGQTDPKENLYDILASLEATIESLPRPAISKPTNYQHPDSEIVGQILESISPKPAVIWSFSSGQESLAQLAVSAGDYVLDFNARCAAVEQNYLHPDLKHQNLLPLVQDLANPTPALGWAHRERHSLEERGPADLVLALGQIPYLAITNHSPFSRIAEYLSGIGKFVIVDFASKEDASVKSLLANYSHNKFSGYTFANFERAFLKYFDLLQKRAVHDGRRVIYLYQTKS